MSKLFRFLQELVRKSYAAQLSMVLLCNDLFYGFKQEADLLHINNAQNCTLLFFKTTNLCKEGKVWEWLHIFQDQPMQDEI